MLAKDIQENYGNGWVKVYRSLKKHWIWKDDKYFKMWVDVLLRANHQDKKVLIEAHLEPVKRGEFITSQKKLAEEYGVSRSKIRTFLTLLEKDSMIELKSTSKFTKLIICNYSSYQDHTPAKEHQKDIKRTSKEHEKNTNNNDKNDKKKKGEVKIIGNRELVISEYFLDLLPIDANQKFVESWVEWVDYRKEIKKKLTKASANKQIGFLLKQPDPLICIEQSIQNQWQGLFEDKSNGKTNSQSAGSVKSRLDYKFDPEKAAKRLKELEDTFS